MEEAAATPRPAPSRKRPPASPIPTTRPRGAALRKNRRAGEKRKRPKIHCAGESDRTRVKFRVEKWRRKAAAPPRRGPGPAGPQGSRVAAAVEARDAAVEVGAEFASIANMKEAAGRQDQRGHERKPQRRPSPRSEPRGEATAAARQKNKKNKNKKQREREAHSPSSSLFLGSWRFSSCERRKGGSCERGGLAFRRACSRITAEKRKSGTRF